MESNILFKTHRNIQCPIIHRASISDRKDTPTHAHAQIHSDIPTSSTAVHSCFLLHSNLPICTMSESLYLYGRTLSVCVPLWRCTVRLGEVFIIIFLSGATKAASFCPPVKLVKSTRSCQTTDVGY